MKRIFLIVSLSILSQAIFAETEELLLEPEFRTDLQSGFSDNHSKNNSASGITTQFLVKRAHLNLRGAFNNQIDYRMRVRWNRNFSQQTDNTSSGLEYWYIRHHFSPQIQFRLGKQFVLQGGTEGSYNPIDVFQYSRVGNRLKDLYTVGASLLLNLDKTEFENTKGQTLILQLMNQIPSGNQNQYAMSYNMAWYGSLLNGDLKSVLQYGVFPSAEVFKMSDSNEKIQTKEAYTTRVYSIGVSLKVGNSQIDLDYLNWKKDGYKELNQNDDIIQHDSEKEDSIVIKAQNQSERLRPFVKWSMDSVKLKQRTELNSYTLGVEIFPFESLTNYRLHGFFTKQETLLNKNKIRNTIANLGISIRL